MQATAITVPAADPFAARATASFPGAFPPLSLAEIDALAAAGPVHGIVDHVVTSAQDVSGGGGTA